MQRWSVSSTFLVVVFKSRLDLSTRTKLIPWSSIRSAFPFLYIALYLILDSSDAHAVGEWVSRRPSLSLVRGPKKDTSADQLSLPLSTCSLGEVLRHLAVRISLV